MSAFEDALAATPDPAPSFTDRAGASTPPPPGSAFEAALAEDNTPKDQGPVPEWSEIPGQALKHSGESAVNFGNNIYQAVRHPITTAENLGSVGLGYMEKAGKNLGLPSGQGYEQYADAVNKMVMDRYGSMDNFKRTLATDPVGAAADLSAVLTGTGLTRLPGVAGKIASTVNTIVDPLTVPAAVAKGVGKVVGGVGKEALGYQTGLGPEVIGQMARTGVEGGEAGKTFRENMRGQVPMEAPVDMARAGVNREIAEKGREYRSGMIDISKDRTVLDWDKIDNAVADADKINNFHGEDLSPETRGIRNKLDDYISYWKDLPPEIYHTPEGFDALKKMVGNLRDKFEAGTPEKKIANEYYGAIRQSIIDQTPAYAGLMKTYEEKSDAINQLQKAFSLPPNERRQVIDTALRKLQSAQRNNVNTNFGYRSQLLDQLEANGAPNLKAALAGQSANTLTPRGLSKVTALLGAEGAAAFVGAWFGGPLAAAAAIPVILASSPRIVGETVHGVSRVAPYSKYVFNKPVARTLQQAGKLNAINIRPITEARGGAVSRALRTAKRR